MTIMTGAEMVVRALRDHSVKHVFGYPGPSTSPVYDELIRQNEVCHITVRHEQGAVHMAQGYARSAGKVGVAIVTSGAGATNSITGLTDALMDSTPLVCITGQVAADLPSADECDIVGATRHCTKHNYLVTSAQELPRVLHEAFHLAGSGRPGPVLVDILPGVAFQMAAYAGPSQVTPPVRSPARSSEPNAMAIEAAVDLMLKAERPVLYTGGGVINSGPDASRHLRELAGLTGFPVTSTLLGIGAFPASDRQWLGMPGLHGTYEANMTMHGCDLMVCIGARFDDRVTGRVSGFSPGSRKIHIDIDPASIGKIVPVDVPIVGDCAETLAALVQRYQARSKGRGPDDLVQWWRQIDEWRSVDSLSYRPSDTAIKPQFAIQRLYEATRNRDVFITTEVGQHQMWTAQHYRFDRPNRLITSGGLGTMGFGLPAAVGVQVANRDALVIDVAGEASIQMTMKELGTAMRYMLPIKVFILNNERLGMVRQQQDFFHGGRHSESYDSSVPDFVRFAEAFGAKGIRCSDPQRLDQAINEMLNHKGAVFFDCLVDKDENCLPMIRSGAAHNDMMLPA